MHISSCCLLFEDDSNRNQGLSDKLKDKIKPKKGGSTNEKKRITITTGNDRCNYGY
jgi:hypothetical protein